MKNLSTANTTQTLLQAGVQSHNAGQLSEAESKYREVLNIDPDNLNALRLLGMLLLDTDRSEAAADVLSRVLLCGGVSPDIYTSLANAQKALGKDEEAIDNYRRAIAIDGKYVEALNNLGTLLKRKGIIAEAINCFENAIKILPTSPQLHNNLGNAFLESGSINDAIKAYNRAIELHPNYAEAHNNLGNSLLQKGSNRTAIDSYRRALSINPGYADAHNNLGIVLQQTGAIQEAISEYRIAIRLNPAFVEAYNNLGTALHELGETEEAIICFKNALSLRRDYAESYNNLGSVWRDRGNLEESREAFMKALELNECFPQAHNNLGATLFEMSDYDQAIFHFEKALEQNVEFSEAYNNLGDVYNQLGDDKKAERYYKIAISKNPSDGWRIKSALFQPSIPASPEEMIRQRQRLEEELDELMDKPLSLKDPHKEVGILPFFTAYQGFNEVRLQRKISAMYEKACPELMFEARQCKDCRARTGQKVRLGIISRFLQPGHIVWKVLEGLVENISREEISLTLFFFEQPTSEVQSALRPEDRIVVLPKILSAARNRIAEESLDILFYTDIGMDPLTYFLAFSRLAPVQCTFWGHPVTTGIRNIDYYLSTDSDEVINAAEHYSEQLIRLPNRPLYYKKPIIPSAPRSRIYFGFDESEHIYLCPATPFKVHPEFDLLIEKILRADSRARVAFVDHKRRRSVELLKERFKRTIPELNERISFVPRQDRDGFLSLMLASDVILDTIHFNGGTTSLEAIGIGLPVVTMATEFLRGRFTAAYFSQIGVDECLADSNEQYVQIALQLAEDKSYRKALSAKIMESNGSLFENMESVRGLEQFFLTIRP
jgi:protein O-GlcNAc transferase